MNRAANLAVALLCVAATSSLAQPRFGFNLDALTEHLRGELGGSDLAGFVNTYGGSADGITDDSPTWSSLNAMAASEPVSVVLNGVSVIDSTMTIDESITIVFVDGGALSPTAGNTVTVDSRLEAGPFQIFAGAGSIAFDSSSKERDLRPEWWGAVADGSTDSTAGLNAAMDASDAMSGARVLLSAGTYEFSSGNVDVHRNTHIIGIDRTFTSVLRPDGPYALTFDGTTTTGGFSFRNTLEYVLINAQETEHTVGAVVLNDGYNIVFRNVNVFEYGTLSANNVGIDVTDVTDLSLENVIVYAVSTDGNNYGIVLGGTSKARLYNVNVEASDNGIRIEDSAKVDIFTPHIERGTTGINVLSSEPVTVVGGEVNNAGSGGRTIDIDGSADRDVTIIGTTFVLAGGLGIRTNEGNFIPGVKLIGVDSAFVSTPELFPQPLHDSGLPEIWQKTYFNRKTQLDDTMSGAHDGANDAATLSDSGESFTVDSLIGQTVSNTTDGSACSITDNDARRSRAPWAGVQRTTGIMVTRGPSMCPRINTIRSQ